MPPSRTRIQKPSNAKPASTQTARTARIKQPPLSSPSSSSSSSTQVTPFQERVYALLLQIPAGRIASYAAIAKALGSAPRAVGGACRRNPFAPEVPCHRCIASTGFLGGFQGDWRTVPSGMNCDKKLDLLRGEGVEFDEEGYLVDQKCWWDEFEVKD